MRKFFVGTLPLISLVVLTILFPKSIYVKNFGLLLTSLYLCSALIFSLLLLSFLHTITNEISKDREVEILKIATQIICRNKNRFLRNVNIFLWVMLFIIGHRLAAVSYAILFLVVLIVENKALRYIEAYRQE